VNAVGERINGVLFDAGGVLIGPVGGRWNPRYDFERIVLTYHPQAPAERFVEAIAEGQRVLDAGVPTVTGTATVNRTDYHCAMLRVLGIARPSAALLHELEAPAAAPAVEVFPDVRPVLDRLATLGVGMSVVSDTWAGLDVGFHEAGIGHYFAGFVMSEVLGCRKPDPRMYAAGSDLLGLAPDECLFVDDDPELVAAAVDLGYHGVVMSRHQQPDHTRPSAGLPLITSLHELVPIVIGTR
jgi:HAD superfamily hydrolase (TIGR01509 family)